MGEHGAMSCTARVYVAGHSLPIKEKNIYTEYFSFFSFQILMTATMRAVWEMLKGW